MSRVVHPGFYHIMIQFSDITSNQTILVSTAHHMFLVSTPMGLVVCLVANVIIPTIDVLSDLNLALRMWRGTKPETTKR